MVQQPAQVFTFTLRLASFDGLRDDWSLTRSRKITLHDDFSLNNISYYCRYTNTSGQNI